MSQIVDFRTLSPPIMATENTAFSSSGEEVIHALIEISDTELPDFVDDLNSYFDVPRTADEIIAGGWKRVQKLNWVCCIITHLFSDGTTIS